MPFELERARQNVVTDHQLKLSSLLRDSHVCHLLPLNLTRPTNLFSRDRSNGKGIDHRDEHVAANFAETYLLAALDSKRGAYLFRQRNNVRIPPSTYRLDGKKLRGVFHSPPGWKTEQADKVVPSRKKIGARGALSLALWC